MYDDSHEIPDEDMEEVVGGFLLEGIDAKADLWYGTCPPCPNCGSTNTRPYPGFVGLPYACEDCETAFG